MIEENDTSRTSVEEVHHIHNSRTAGHGIQASLKEPDQCLFILPDEILAMVFSHLPLRDRFRLCMVNLQWWRCAFLILPKLEVHLREHFDGMLATVNDDFTYFHRAFGTEKSVVLLRLFRTSIIRHVAFDIYNPVFNQELLCLMTEIARKASTVSVVFSVEIPRTFSSVTRSEVDPLSELITLCKVLGPHITRLHFPMGVDTNRFSVDCFHVMLAQLKKLKALKCETLSLFLPFQCKVPEDCFQQLEEVEFSAFYFNSPSMKVLWREFVDRFRNQLKRLHISVYNILERDIEEFMMLLRHFVRLECLFLSHDTISYSELRQFVPLIHELATACPRLTTLEILWHWQLEVPIATIESLFTTISKFNQLQTVNLWVQFLVPEMCDELSILRMLQNVASPKNFRRDLKVSHYQNQDWEIFLQVVASMGLDISNNPFVKLYLFELSINDPIRCKTYYI